MDIKEYISPSEDLMNYAVAAPADCTDLPLLVFLHGAGERGRKIDHLYRHGIPKLLKEGMEYPAVILYPQCPAPFIWNNMVKELKELIDRVAAEYGIKDDRIMITGCSMGGYGTWEMAMCYPETFAAVGPVAGGGVMWRTSKLKDVPVIAYHGSEDSAVLPSQSQVLVEYTNLFGGHAELHLLEGMEHNDGIDYAYRNTDLIPRLLSYRKTDHSHVPEVCEGMF